MWESTEKLNKLKNFGACTKSPQPFLRFHMCPYKYHKTIEQMTMLNLGMEGLMHALLETLGYI